MKALKFLAASLLIALPGVAQAQWYMGADAGVNFLEDASVTNSANGFAGQGSSKTG